MNVEVVISIRLASKSKGKGKSGGFRIITYLLETWIEENGEEEIEVTLLSIYDKSEVSTLSDSEIKKLIDSFLEEKTNEKDADEN